MDSDVPFKDYVDGQLSEVRRAIDIALAASKVEGVPLREYIEAVLVEQTRALDMAAGEREKAASALREQTQRALDKADAEREKAASALRSEQQRALDKADTEREKAASVLREEQARAIATAEREREKAASILRQELTERIRQGDSNLLSHIDQQIAQIREALQGAEKLEVHRTKAAEDLARSVQRELLLVQQSAERAIQKAEFANEKRFEGVNEFRAQLADQTATFLPREVAEANFAELRKSISTNTEQLNRIAGSGAAARRSQDRAQPWQVALTGSAITAVIAIVVLIATLLANHY